MQHTLSNPFTQKRRQRHLITLTIATVAVVVTAVIVFLILQSQRTGLIIQDSADRITIRLNGRVVTGETRDEGIYLPLYAGRYRLQIDREGYQPFVIDVETQPGEILSIRPAFALIPWVEESPWAGGIDFVRAAADERSVYFLGDYRQRIFRLEVATQTTIPLTDQPLFGVTDVQWSDNPNVALITQTDGVYLHEIPRFDFQNQIFDRVAGPEVVSPVWDPKNSNRIAAAYFTASGEESLITADKRFTEIRRLVFLDGQIPRPKVRWSADGSHLLVLGRSDVSSKQNAWLYTLETGELKQLTEGGSVTDASLSPDSGLLLYSQLTTQGIRTRAVLNLADGTITNIEGDTPVARTAWRDGNHFFEPDPEGKGIAVRSGSTGQLVETIPVQLPQNEPIQSMLYYQSPGRVIVATDTAVYTVSVDSE